MTGSVSVDLGFAAAGLRLPTNLLHSTKLYQCAQKVRFASAGSGPFQWVFGTFYSTVDRNDQQTPPTPGHDAFTDAVLGAGRSAAVANGFDADSLFNSELPYDIRQLAGIGEATCEIMHSLKFTAGGRYWNHRRHPERESACFCAEPPVEYLAGLRSRTGGRARLAFSTNQPRTFGITTRYKF